MNSNRLHHQFPAGVTTVLFLTGIAVCISGCGDAAGKQNKQTEIPAVGSLFVPIVETVEVRGEDFVEHIELPGVSVHGMESTPLYAKIGGFVKEIRRVGRVEYLGKPIQITDTVNRKTYEVRNIVLRDEKNRVIRATTVDDLKAKWPKLHAAYTGAKMMEIDIGSKVVADTLLAVLDIPEMADDLKKQQAVIERANQTVLQKTAAIRSADAVVLQRGAEAASATKARDAVTAKLKKDNKELTRITNLIGNVEKSLLEELEFKVAATTAALASAVQQIKSAEETVKVAKASVDKAKADLGVAKAMVTEAKAELSRLKTLEDYASIRAPFSGTIIRRFVDHGSFVRSAQQNSGAKPVFAITQTSEVRIVIPVPGRTSYKIRLGQETVFHTIGGLPGVTVKGTITLSASILDPMSRTMRVEMHLKNPATNLHLVRDDGWGESADSEAPWDDPALIEGDGRGWKERAPSKNGKTSESIKIIRPGMFGVVTVRKQWKQLRMVPASAVGVDGSERYLLEIVSANGGKSKLVKRFVTVVFNDAKIAGISDGIEVGARIVADGIAGLKDRMKVTYKE